MGGRSKSLLDAAPGHMCSSPTAIGSEPANPLRFEAARKFPLKFH